MKPRPVSQLRAAVEAAERAHVARFWRDTTARRPVGRSNKRWERH